MKLEIINQTPKRIPRRFLEQLFEALRISLRARNIGKDQLGLLVVLVFLDSRAAKELNRKFRGKNYATDVLSFAGDGFEVLGELIFCPSTIERQAQEHNLSFRDELGYLCIHGLLHLLGFEHENGGRAAKQMYELQDALFEDLCLGHETVKKSK